VSADRLVERVEYSKTSPISSHRPDQLRRRTSSFFSVAQLAADPSLRPGRLVEAITERFGVRVHARSIERALARGQQPKSDGDRR
jgi:hypothetical protein